MTTKIAAIGIAVSSNSTRGLLLQDTADERKIISPTRGWNAATNDNDTIIKLIVLAAIAIVREYETRTKTSVTDLGNIVVVAPGILMSDCTEGLFGTRRREIAKAVEHDLSTIYPGVTVTVLPNWRAGHYLAGMEISAEQVPTFQEKSVTIVVADTSGCSICRQTVNEESTEHGGERLSWHRFALGGGLDPACGKELGTQCLRWLLIDLANTSKVTSLVTAANVLLGGVEYLDGHLTPESLHDITSTRGVEVLAPVLLRAAQMGHEGALGVVINECRMLGNRLCDPAFIDPENPLVGLTGEMFQNESYRELVVGHLKEHHPEIKLLHGPMFDLVYGAYWMARNGVKQ